MKVDSLGIGDDLSTVADAARAAEQAGYDGYWIPEIAHDPFIGLTLASGVTSTIELGTAIAVAFARNPMQTAVLANDLQTVSGGRFALGLGSQIRPHITKRFSMPWSQPADRMREYVRALRAIWASWATGERLAFRGDFYTHTLMTPFFSPGPNPYGPPPVHLAAVGERMTEAAGEVADGLIAHSFATPRYLREVTLPAVARGQRKADRDAGGFDVSWSVFAVTGRDDKEMATADAAVRNQIAFYGSTPAYLPVLDLHGWSGLHEKLNGLSKRGEWARMAAAITDEVLREFAVVGPPDTIAGQIRERTEAISRISFYAPYALDSSVWQGIMADLRS